MTREMGIRLGKSVGSSAMLHGIWLDDAQNEEGLPMTERKIKGRFDPCPYCGCETYFVAEASNFYCEAEKKGCGTEYWKANRDRAFARNVASLSTPLNTLSLNGGPVDHR